MCSFLLTEEQVLKNHLQAPRPYLSVAGTLFMWVGTAALVFPLCDILTIIGELVSM